MSDPAAVETHQLGKRFKLYTTATQRLLDWLPLSGPPRYEEFWALRDITFQVPRGECFGIIGPNGAGKSTLLKLLTGALLPTSGELHVAGRVLSLLELGTGFNPELTGRQNVYQSGRLLSLGRGDVAVRLDAIQAFADLGDYFDRPVKQYSSGMFVRLAFALFSALNPDVFIVDEALSVGDLRFANKALARIREMVAHGTTLIFVSHDLQLVNQLCARAMWIHAGSMQMLDAAAEVTRAYQQFMVHGAPTLSLSRAPASPLPAASAALPAPHDRGPSVASVAPLPQVGPGWYPLEAFGGAVFRWAMREAALMIPETAAGHTLLLDVEPGVVDAAREPLLRVRLGQDVLGTFALTGRERLDVAIPRVAPGESHLLILELVGASAPPAREERDLALRLFRCGWDKPPALRPVADLDDWTDGTQEVQVERELASMHAALGHSPPRQDAPARIRQVVTTGCQGAPRVRFASHETVILDVTVEASRDVDDLVVGVQIRDTFDRMLSGTRTDYLTSTPAPVAAGERISVKVSLASLPLGAGVYQWTVAICQRGHEHDIWQWVDGAWRCEVVGPVVAAFDGMVDLGWSLGAPGASDMRTAGQKTAHV